MRVLFITAAAICITVAAVLSLRQQLDAAFVVAAMGVVAWLLSYRIQMKRIIAKTDLAENNQGEDLDEEPDN